MKKSRTEGLDQKLGQLVMFGFEGVSLTSSLSRFISDYKIGGVIIFSRNVQSPDQLRDLILELQGIAEEELLISVDHEGSGRFSLGRPFTEFATHRLQDFPHVAFDVGRAMGRELKSTGINMDFAPVMDVNTNRKNPIIGERALSDDPKLVAEIGLKLIEGFNNARVMACAKHFPGHGDTDCDSHLARPILKHGLRRLKNIELPPFEAAIKHGVDSVMTAHIIYDCLDKELPATLSEKIINGLLRKELGYNGVVFTDGLRMKAISSFMPVEEAALASIKAGVDIALVCRDEDLQTKTMERLYKAVRDKELTEKRIEESFSRIMRLKRKYLGSQTEIPALSVIGCEEHLKLAEVLRDKTSGRSYGCCSAGSN